MGSKVSIASWGEHGGWLLVHLFLMVPSKMEQLLWMKNLLWNNSRLFTDASLRFSWICHLLSLFSYSTTQFLVETKSLDIVNFGYMKKESVCWGPRISMMFHYTTAFSSYDFVGHATGRIYGLLGSTDGLMVNWISRKLKKKFSWK